VTASTNTNLIVSFGSTKQRDWKVGALLRIVGKFGQFHEVDFVAIHPDHPCRDLPLEKWVAGLTRSGDRLLLKPTMIAKRVASESQYLDEIEAKTATDKQVYKIARYAGFAEARLRVNSWKMEKQFRSTILTSVGPLGKSYYAIPEWGTNREFALVSPYVIKGKRKIKFTMLKEQSVRDRFTQYADFLLALPDAIRVRLIDRDKLRVEPIGELDELGLHSGFFYINEAKKGIYILKKSPWFLLIDIDAIEKLKLPQTFDELIDVANQHADWMDQLRIFKSDPAMLDRQIKELRLNLNAMRIAD
jgi:hypothetical protein